MTASAVVPARRLALPAPRSRAPRKSVRLELTRRGRLVRSVLVLVIALVIAAAVMTATGATSALADWAQGPERVAVTVQQGDTLWGYAREYAPEGTDVRDWVIEVQQANHLPSAQLTAGTQIEIPVEH